MNDTSFPGGSDNEESACNARNLGSIPGLRRSTRGGDGPTQVFLPGESHGQRSLAGYSPWGHKESDMTDQLSTAKYTMNDTRHTCKSLWKLREKFFLQSKKKFYALVRY